MKMSESVKELAMALAAAQAEMPAADLNAVNPFLKNKFADLGSIISTAKPVLAKHGLSVSQLPTTIDECVGVTTVLMHSSGEWLESTILLPIADEKGKSLAQVAGSIITYLRRYSLASVLGMYAEEDSDGEPGSPKQSGSAPKRKQPKATPQTSGSANTAREKWDKSLVEMGITSVEALRRLGVKSVNDWIKAEKGRTLEIAIETINASL